MVDTQTTSTDYLVIGAGAMGMGFVDQLIEKPDVEVVMVDRRHGPGGHWLDAYPFVRLHQPSVLYGVNSTPLGEDRVIPVGAEAGHYERASSSEICGYYDQVMQHRLLGSGRVQFHPMSEYLGDRRFRSLSTGRVTEVEVRRSVVDATFMASRVPASEPPPFEVAPEAHLVPVGGLTGIAAPPAGYVVIGGGKTAYDACCWLLDQGTDPDSITWIRPRDSWMQNRSYTQPLGLVRNALESVVLHMEALAESDTVEDVFARLEEHGVMLRIDPTVDPALMRGATMSVAERDQLRRIEEVVRLGHVLRVESDRIVLQEGSIPTTPDHLHIHCAAPGLSDGPPAPIFGEDSITLQVVTRASLSLSAGLLGYLESTDRSTAEKNRLAPPNPWPQTPFDWLRFLLGGIRTDMGWNDAPDLAGWVDRSRLNILRDLPTGEDPDVVALQGRLFESLGPAFEKLETLAQVATPAERARIFVSPADAA